ncbi:hypothetical protein [Streptomyces sp. FIT100]|uniref:hypothetical protein n=1 Tax=Streptomyces sp. FIT100 TaxID=2837956 RepID=UPI0021C7BC2F|nr:hypothetical protein [Streptomyces sp. FIT100]UUN26762.1 hypothetical protein KK483_10325 [Streptomyces sp. FIT100]
MVRLKITASGFSSRYGKLREIDDQTGGRVEHVESEGGGVGIVSAEPVCELGDVQCFSSMAGPYLSVEEVIEYLDPHALCFSVHTADRFTVFVVETELQNVAGLLEGDFRGTLGEEEENGVRADPSAGDEFRVLEGETTRAFVGLSGPRDGGLIRGGPPGRVVGPCADDFRAHQHAEGGFATSGARFEGDVGEVGPSDSCGVDYLADSVAQAQELIVRLKSDM